MKLHLLAAAAAALLCAAPIAADSGVVEVRFIVAAVVCLGKSIDVSRRLLLMFLLFLTLSPSFTLYTLSSTTSLNPTTSRSRRTTFFSTKKSSTLRPLPNLLPTTFLLVVAHAPHASPTDPGGPGQGPHAGPAPVVLPGGPAVPVVLPGGPAVPVVQHVVRPNVIPAIVKGC